MRKLGSAAFVGKSGHRYEFGVYPLDVQLKSGHGGVYVVTARKDDDQTHHRHHRILIGETDDLGGLMADHPEKAAFEAEGANCLCIHATEDPTARARIAKDIEAHTPPA